MKPRIRIAMSRVIAITIGFVITNVFVALLIDSVINSNYAIGPSAEYNFPSYIILSVVVGLVAGGLGGIVLVQINNNLFRKKSFAAVLARTALFYIIVFTIVNAISSIITVNLLFEKPALEQVAHEALVLMFNPLTVAIFSLWGIVSLLTLFLLQVSDKFGPGKLWKFIRGHYFHPREEERVFMFADLRSSTTIAEKLSHKVYFNLLNDLFSDITNTILNNEGEIYQYVGDEIVISWPLNKGIRNNNCIRCFMDIEQRISSMESYYMSNYGLKPELKAGVHHGKVISGEIGIIKKDIVYTGDVLNTTSRIQEQCNSNNVNFLISEDTIKLMNEDSFNIQSLGEFNLRGKEQLLKLFTVLEPS